MINTDISHFLFVCLKIPTSVRLSIKTFGPSCSGSADDFGCCLSVLLVGGGDEVCSVWQAVDADGVLSAGGDECLSCC